MTVRSTPRRNELGEFLRARRAAVRPGQVGLPEDDGRRVAGLRREEVALLAGVSTDYLTRLEQGRERTPSVQVLEAVARALCLDTHSTAHLFRIGRSTPRAVAPPSSAQVAPVVLDLLNRYIDAPATVVGPALDVLAMNSMAEALYAGFATRDNLLRMIFLDPAAPAFYRSWDKVARGAVRDLRAISATFPDDPRIHEVTGELAVRSPAFAALWPRNEVRPRTQEDKDFHHPEVGDLTLHFQAFAVTAAPGQQLFVYTCTPGSSSEDGLTLLKRMSDVLVEPPVDDGPAGLRGSPPALAHSEGSHPTSQHREGPE